MSQGPQFQPGDVVGGFVLGADGRWWPSPAAVDGYAPLGERAAPDYGRTGRTIVIVSAVVVVLGILGAIVGTVLIAGLIWTVSQSSPSDGWSVWAGSVPVGDLRVGDCFIDQGDESVEYVDVVACSEPHDAEVVLVDAGFFAGPDALPSDQEVDVMATPACRQALEAYTGQPYEDSDYDFWYFLPGEQTWSEGDRALTCVGIVGTGELTEGSIRDGDATAEGRAALASPRSRG